MTEQARPLVNKVKGIQRELNVALDAMRGRAVTPLLTNSIESLKEGRFHIGVALDGINKVYDALEDLNGVEMNTPGGDVLISSQSDASLTDEQLAASFGADQATVLQYLQNLKVGDSVSVHDISRDCEVKQTRVNLILFPPPNGRLKPLPEYIKVHVRENRGSRHVKVERLPRTPSEVAADLKHAEPTKHASGGIISAMSGPTMVTPEYKQGIEWVIKYFEKLEVGDFRTVPEISGGSGTRQDLVAKILFPWNGQPDLPEFIRPVKGTPQRLQGAEKVDSL